MDNAMKELTQEKIEMAGEGFSPEAMKFAREKTWECIEHIRSQIQVGMREDEGLAIANAAIKELGAEKRWHRSWVRFGVNTLKPYGVPSEPDVVLQENDLFFVDLGPVWKGVEGDAGQTFVVGDDPEMKKCVRDGRALWDEVRAKWETEALGGDALYRFAESRAKEMGWVFNLVEANGHRLSDFPHAIHYRGGISDIDFTPAPYRWVLEIQLKHPTRPFGSFYEDLLC